jgi:ElaB/YqjD/DUF883 family membrane-anchored ribosome-binding protein
MNAAHSEDEMFDDLHSGVTALQDLIREESVPLTPKAAETIQRLETTVPTARERLRHWKEILKVKATHAAEKTDRVIHDYPWFFTLGALTLGVLAGMSLSGSREDEDAKD